MKRTAARFSALLLSLLLLLNLSPVALALGGGAGLKLVAAPIPKIVSDGGVVSSPILSSHSPNKTGTAKATLPASFILPATRQTSVKDQGAYGTCWAHATMASAESIGKTRALASDLDFSEWQLSYYTYTSQSGRPAFDMANSTSPYQNGGNDSRAAAMFARGSSPVLESQAPYGGSTPSATIKPSYELKSWAIAHTSTEWKTFLTTMGALYISYYEKSQYYNKTTHSYYNPDEYGITNHAVTLVGWDDNYPASNFTQKPSGNGAWIIKNSWGSGWGASGYFYMSYYSQDLRGEASAFEVMKPVANEKEYTYDDLGWLNEVGFGSDTASMKSVFTSAGAETLKSIGTYAVGDNAAYRIQVTTKNAAGTFVPVWSAPQTGTIAASGYARIELAHPVSLAVGQKYEVLITFTVPGTSYPLPVEESLINYSTSAKFAAGQSYFSADGVSDWIDGNDCPYPYDTSIYAFTVPTIVDNAAPVITLKNASAVVLPTGAYANTDVTVTITDASVVTKAVKRNGAALAWPTNNIFTLEGEYVVTATDASKNVSTVLFRIDKTTPVVSGKANNATVANNAFVKYSVVATTADANLLTRIALVNGVVVAWPSTNTFSSAGTYLLMAIDRAGNMGSLSFTVDKTLPVITVKSASGTVVANNGTVKAKAIVTVSDANITGKSVKKNGAAITWPTTNTFASVGKYVVTATDKAGNVATVTFTIN